MYRHHTLAGARAKAAKAGWAGAMYAWESADTGEEATPERVRGPDGKPIEILCGTQEQHITADVAYAVWQYWKATGDDGFMAAAGAEILMDTARFWASRAQPEADGLHHIRGIIGPDEYHEHVDDNAFTNIMAAWNIFRGLDAAAWLKGHLPERWTELAGQMGISDSGLAQWRQVADTMATGLDPVTGLFEQFSGYHGLKEIDLTEYSGRTVPMDVVLGREAVQASQVIKQADVVALLALLPDAFGRRTAEVNFRHYEPRCGHGSSLSPAMHGLVAARLGDGGMALKHFRHTAALDLEDNNGGTAGGVRIAALGGLWQVAMLGFAGLSLRSDGLAFDPQLPSGWESLGFRVQWRGRQIRVSIEGCGGAFEASLERGDAMTLAVRGEAHRLRHGQVLRVPREVVLRQTNPGAGLFTAVICAWRRLPANVRKAGPTRSAHHEPVRGILQAPRALAAQLAGGIWSQAPITPAQPPQFVTTSPPRTSMMVHIRKHAGHGSRWTAAVSGHLSAPTYRTASPSRFRTRRRTGGHRCTPNARHAPP